MHRPATTTPSPIGTAEARTMRRATLASLAVALVMIALKAWAWQKSGSVSLLSSLLDSAMDSAASLLNFLAVRYALEPADHNHRFGHGKAEDMSGLAQALIIAGSSLFLLHEAWLRLQEPTAITHSEEAISVMLISLVLTTMLVFYQRFAIRKTGSIAVRADQAHYTMDIMSNLGVLAVLYFSTRTQLWWLDGGFALLCGLFFLHGAWKIGIEAFQRLMDHEFSDEERADIEIIVRAIPNVLGMHDLRTRQSGMRQFIQFHLELDKHQSLESAHTITVDVENALHAAYPKAEIFVHQDPR